MKQSVPPAVAIGAIVAALVILAAFVFLRSGNRSAAPPTGPTGGGMPPQVAAEIQKRLAGTGATPPPGGVTPVAPPAPR